MLGNFWLVSQTISSLWGKLLCKAMLETLTTIIHCVFPSLLYQWQLKWVGKMKREGPFSVQSQDFNPMWIIA